MTEALPARGAPSWRTEGIAIAGSAVDAAGALQRKQRGASSAAAADTEPIRCPGSYALK